MSTYVYMRILESAPRRYDLGIRLLSLGGVDTMYDAVAAAAVGERTAPRVLELGCGTGNLTRALVRRGAIVTAIDQNAEMLAVAREKIGDAAELREMAAVEIGDRFAPDGFDAVAGSLVLSEMSPDERVYVLRAARRVLRPGGRLVLADEVRPEGRLARVLHALRRWPLAVVTWLVTQSGTSAVPALGALVEAAGFRVLDERRLARAGVGLVVAERPAEGMS
jgi:ubiquinone/menaquinone biosynthesis C-methylase UbiE